MVGTTSVAEPVGVRVYNFTVADDHTYFVEGFGGASGVTGSAGTSAPLDAVWVHNTCFRRALIARMGLDPGANFEAHHIIPVNDGGDLAGVLRNMLDRLGISIDDPANGVLLQKAEHAEIHFDTDEYIGQLYYRLLSAEKAGGADAVRAELQAIGEKLSRGVQEFLEEGL